MQARTHSKIAAVAHVPCFADLAPQTLDAMADLAVLKRTAVNEVAFLAGDMQAGLGIVKEGRLKVIRLSPTGREQILSILYPGDVFNAVSVLAEAPTPATVVALEPSALWVISRQDLHQLQDRYPALTRCVARTLARRALRLIDLVEDLSFRTVEARVARQLLQRSQDSVLHREAWATQAEISSRMGTVTYVINRVLRSFEEEGLIDVTRDQIRILDSQGLAAKVETK